MANPCAPVTPVNRISSTSPFFAVIAAGANAQSETDISITRFDVEFAEEEVSEVEASDEETDESEEGDEIKETLLDEEELEVPPSPAGISHAARIMTAKDTKRGRYFFMRMG